MELKGTIADLRMVKITDLHIDPEAQRTYSKRDVQRILDDGYEDALAGALTVAADPREVLWVVDGQTRMRAAEASGHTEVLCVIWPNVTPAMRARLFVKGNRDRRNVDRYDMHRVAVVAGMQPYVDIDDALRSRGLEAARKASDTGVGGLAGVKRIIDRHGREVLEHSLDLVLAAWPHYGGERWQPDLLQGIGFNVALNLTSLDDARYITKLREQSPTVWKATLAQWTAGPGGSAGRPRTAARMLAQAYNTGLRGGARGLPKLKAP